jgi:hypothetical protein
LLLYATQGRQTNPQQYNKAHSLLDQSKPAGHSRAPVRS